MMKIILFTKNTGPYSPGDRAGFTPEAAAAYIARGEAREDAPAPDTPEATDTPAPVKPAKGKK